MRLLLWMPLLMLLLGCNLPRRQPLPALTAAQASALAQTLANEKAQLLYQCQPFVNSPEALLDLNHHWVWSARQGYGNVDVEATVSFAEDGTDREVDVLLLDNRRLLMPQKVR